MNKPKNISPEKVHDLLRQDPGALLVCAYEKEEDFRQNDLEGAISLNQFRKRADSLPKDENIVFYCACPHDEAATREAKEYSKRGFRNVRILEGGVNAWRSAGYGLVPAST